MSENLNSDCVMMENIIEKGGSSLFYSFSNAEGKQWIMPQRNMRVAMNLYQPTRWKGKLVKYLMPWLFWFPKVWQVVNVERLYCTLREDLHLKLCQVFNCDDFEFAIFGGTPGWSKKITIQVFINGKILGYCKVSDQEDIISMFYHEKRILDSLEANCISSIPHCLFIGTIDDFGTTIFVQTTKKTDKSKITQEWTLHHDNFLIELNQKTKRKIPFEDSDYYKIIKDFKANLCTLPEDDRKLLENAIKVIILHYSNCNKYSAFHGDFTPWNMFIERGKLFAFDLEYAELSFPPHLDYFHYILQVALIVKGYKYEDAYNYSIKHIQKSPLSFHDYHVSFVAYIVYVIALNFKLFKNDIVTGDNNYPTRCHLIMKLLNDLDKTPDYRKI